MLELFFLFFCNFPLPIISLLRLVAEVHMERKMKSQKAKSKSSDGRKQLSNVRVIRRNLVYIVGLPLDLADEDVIFVLHLLPVVMPFNFSPCSKWKI